MESTVKPKTMGQEINLLKSIRRIEPRNVALGLLIGCFLVTFAYFSITKFDTFRFFMVNSPSTENVATPSGAFVQNMVSVDSEQPDTGPSRKESFSKDVPQIDLDNEAQNVPTGGENRNISSINSNNSSIISKIDLISEESVESTVQELDDSIIEVTKETTDACDKKHELCSTRNESASNKASTNTPISSTVPPSIDWKLSDTTIENKSKTEIKKQVPLCDLSQRRIDKCEIEGDVRIIGRNATVMWVPSPESDGGPDYERKVWQIKPYPRKEDPAAMSHVRIVTVKPTDGPDDAPACMDHRDVPAIVFSDRGYTGNYFHDFTDVLIPIFTTARRFQGEVEFLVTDFRIYWIMKYLPIFKNLTKYDLVDFDSDEQVRCYKKAYIGLTSHDDFGIDPDRIPERYTLVDFTRFMRTTYGLERDIAEIPIQKTLGRKPRLMIVARAKTRRFMNLDEIVRAAEKLGFEVVATEATNELVKFSVVVNSCDAIMGVHGAGLTNMVFLPINTVFIQILPWGGLEWVAGNYFKRPVEKMKLKYLQYDITPEESTLIDEYPRNHTVFTDPASIRRQGWNAMKEVFLDKQNVRLNIKRFRPTLKKALKHLNSEDS
ncbi:Glycosyltransferase family 61 protein [Rhynchospora pubera]|uniref:Glycosyltransferase family 61 protein n=1 Tax=Rhynchospora pubera TaxID=906938 RepID=A0AAV8DFT7_9POAL|nr:Glycosyltransferase family 61 protein [Rhynchospora pubera]